MTNARMLKTVEMGDVRALLCQMMGRFGMTVAAGRYLWTRSVEVLCPLVQVRHDTAFLFAFLFRGHLEIDNPGL